GGNNPTTFGGNLQISNSNGVRLSQNATVVSGLTLSNGIIDALTDNTTLTIGSTSSPGTLSGGSDTSYVSGKLARVFSAGSATGKKFPIGKGGYYRPVTVAITTL